MTQYERLLSILSKFSFIVESMRMEQKRYFATKNPIALKNAKHIEKKVDECLEAFRKNKTFGDNPQQYLFDKE